MLSKKTLLLLCVSVPSFMINLDANIVAVSLTSIARSLHADFTAIEWVISAYTLAFATMLMPSGALADRFGRKKILMIGLTIFTIASGVCGAAPDTTVLNVARGVQGLGAAMQLSSALAILAHGFSGKEKAKAFAFWGSVIGIAATLGPVVGGLITQSLGWEWAFYINLPIGIVMITLTAYTIVESKDPKADKIDAGGVVTFSAFLGLVTWVLISGHNAGWGSPAILTESICALVFFVAFITVEISQKRPMVDLRYFLKPTFFGASMASVAYAVGFLTMLTYLPFFFQSGLGRSPLAAGLMMLPLAVPLVIVPRIITLFLDHRLSGRALLTTGLALAGIGLLATGMVIQQFSYPLILCTMLIASTGAGLLNGQIAKVSMSVIPVERAGMASGLAATMRFSGLVVGFAALGAILFARIQSSVSAGLGNTASVDRRLITHSIANGDVSAAAASVVLHNGDAGLVAASLGYGYSGVFITGAIVAFIAMTLAWTLIRSAETAPSAAGAALREEALLD